jgi:RNA polymerase primary sigma factor
MLSDHEGLSRDEEEEISLTWLDPEENEELKLSRATPPKYLMTNSLDLNRAYIDEIARTSLLTAEEEVSLTKRMLRARSASQKMTDSRIGEEKRSKLRTILEDGLAARERLLMANTRLVISVAKRYSNRGIPFLDLVQEGIVGLMRAAGKFDPDRGNRFSTYATWWIRQAITRAIDNNSRTIRLPVHVTSQLSKIARATSNLEQEFGRPPTNEEIAAAVEMDPELVRSSRRLVLQPISLEAPQDEDENRMLGDLVADAKTEMPEEAVSSTMLREHIDDALAELPWREAKVLRLRYGLRGNPAHTLHQVGTVMGITRERVRQIEASALRRLRAIRHHEQFEL